MGFQRFEDIIAWQKGQDLAVAIYNEFGKCRDFGFKNQICDATISISNNIAEGFDRSSDKEFIRFLYYSLGSASEVKSMLYLAPRISLCTEDKANELLIQVNEVGRIVAGLIKNLKSKL